MVARKVFQENVEIISDTEALYFLGQQAFSMLIGAGVSAEAQVPLANQISEDIRTRLIESLNPPDPKEWASQNLSWDDLSRRYATCLRRYGPPARRVEYFRQLLKGKTPCFAHYAVALLMSREYLRPTCFTTNFDKLIETAFSELGQVTCQPIRTNEEAGFWGSELDKCYVLKLHGDYDTHNVLNTREETTKVAEFHTTIAGDLLRASGLLVLGAAGHEESVRGFIRALTDPRTEHGRPANLMSLGLFWGVYAGPVKPQGITDDQAADVVQAKLTSRVVSQEVTELMAQAHSERRPCVFFPVWGAGNFLFSLIRSFKDISLSRTAELYLDHETRLRNVFQKQLTTDAIEKHLTKLEAQRRSIAEQALRSGVAPETVWQAQSADRKLEVRVTYGDITSRSMMGADTFAATRRAVVSPEDTAISAGGGVAYSLLVKAGPRFILNELGKLSPIAHRSVAVTSAGNLPVHYILHAAAMRIESDGSYVASGDDVEATMRAILDSMAALHIDVVWVPLLASGVGLLTSDSSLESLVRAVASAAPRERQTSVNLVIYRESMVGRDKVGEILKRLLNNSFVVEKFESEG
jgi:O-acetyl-ADP-ribose deacetylase